MTNCYKQIFLGDCLELYKNIKPKSISLILTDLPYGTINCKWDTIIPFNKLWKMVNYLLKPNGAFITTASQPFTSALVMSNPKWFKFAWIWNKKFNSNFALKNYQPQKIHEDILVFSNGVCIFNGQKIKRDEPIKHGANKCKSESSRIAHAKVEYENKIYEYKEPESILYYSNRAEKRGYHPTQKPIALMEYLIKTYSNEFDFVFDPCMGSGTTGVACKNLNRNFIGIEKDEKYFKIAEQRINECTIF
jgi:site-specific DNA-methyltransferase (adenine-specific)